jgi:large subunit ribosomal protein L21
VKARLALIWAAIVAAGVAVVGTLTGRRRQRRAQRGQAREQRRAKKAQRRAQGGGRRPGSAPTRAGGVAATPSAPTDTEAPALASAPAGPSADPPPTEAAGDDLRAIKGLGAVAAEKLRGAGVTTWAQIAAWTPEEARELALRLELQPGRIASDDWVGQARALVEARDGGPAPGA